VLLFALLLATPSQVPLARASPPPRSGAETVRRGAGGKTPARENPEIATYVEALKKRYGGPATVALRRLYHMAEDYPRQALLDAIQSAAQYGLYDLERVESMILRKLAREYFLIIPLGRGGEGDDE